MNPTASSAPTSSRRVLVIGGTRYIGAHRAKHLQHRCSDVIILGNLSARCLTPTRKGEYILPGNHAGRAKPVTSLLCSSAYDKHLDANGSIAST